MLFEEDAKYPSLRAGDTPRSSVCWQLRQRIGSARIHMHSLSHLFLELYIIYTGNIGTLLLPEHQKLYDGVNKHEGAITRNHLRHPHFQARCNCWWRAAAASRSSSSSLSAHMTPTSSSHSSSLRAGFLTRAHAPFYQPYQPWPASPGSPLCARGRPPHLAALRLARRAAVENLVRVLRTGTVHFFAPTATSSLHIRSLSYDLALRAILAAHLDARRARGRPASARGRCASLRSASGAARRCTRACRVYRTVYQRAQVVLWIVRAPGAGAGTGIETQRGRRWASAARRWRVCRSTS